MKKIILFFLVALISVNAQFKDAPSNVDIKSGIVNSNTSSFLLGFINPQNFQMNHTFSMSYTSFGKQGLALGVYTNSMAYNFSEDLNIEADVSFVNSPYSSLGSDHAKQLNGIYLSRAALNYRPSDNTFISIQFNQLPYGYDYGYGIGSPFRSSRYLPFSSDPFDKK